MFKSFIATTLALFCLILSACSPGVSGLESYINPNLGYQFLYPNGWIPVAIKGGGTEGVDVIYRDLINRDENLSVIISDVPAGKTLADLGSPTEVGYRFLKNVNSDPSRQQETEFITAKSRDINGKNYYLLEYEVDLPNGEKRHNLASVVVNRNKLFTFNISTNQERWEKMADTFTAVTSSFRVD
ncbi:MAG: photosystem II oxygen evolving complex protein PsbP [Cyanobacteria bacterium J083]|nr:MAG: photosystem II oxygen evolving complex protein PsbP [Cyanobacteria bacterium J083]